jgi:hypothetical protein
MSASDSNGIEGIRSFFYIDDMALRSYFTQLPQRERNDFEKQYTTSKRYEFELSLNPAVRETLRESRLPYDLSVALLLYIEKTVFDKRPGAFGTFENIEGRFVRAVCDVKYAYIDHRTHVAPGSPGILIAYPNEGMAQRLSDLRKSYVILGDVRNCTTAPSNMALTPGGVSPFSRLVAVWDEIWKHEMFDTCDDIDHFPTTRSGSGPFGRHRMPYIQFAGRDESVFESFGLIELERHLTFVHSRFRGVLMVRDRVRRQGEELAVLYPIYLERV